MIFLKNIIKKMSSCISKMFLPKTEIYQIDKPQEILIEDIDKMDSSFENTNYQNFFDDSNDRKKEFFELYENYKNGKVSLENILITDLIELELMMCEECELLENKIQESKKYIVNQEKDISFLEKQQEFLEKKLEINNN